MRVEYIPSLADYKAALQLHNRGKLSRRVSQSLLIWGGPAIAVLFLIVVVTTFFLVPTRFTSGFFVTLGFLVILLLIPFIHSRGVRKQFDLLYPPSTRGKTVCVEMDRGCIVAALPGRGEGKLVWNDVRAYAQNERVTMLYLRKRRFLFVPTQAFSPAQRAEFEELMSSHVVRRQPC